MPCYIMRNKAGEKVGFMCGDLGPQCSCGSAADFLCDWPVGNDKTCDRNLCQWCATQVFADTHYCRDHAQHYGDWMRSQGDNIEALRLRPRATPPAAKEA